MEIGRFSMTESGYSYCHNSSNRSIPPLAYYGIGYTIGHYDLCLAAKLGALALA